MLHYHLLFFWPDIPILYYLFPHSIQDKNLLDLFSTHIGEVHPNPPTLMLLCKIIFTEVTRTVL